MADFDLAIVGGGINGAGIARDAAGRGLRVLLVEQGDLASGTSSASTKLIHGGLRYLEHGWFRLVREALIEREVMLRMAPHLIRPMRFVLPPAPGLRSPWLLRDWVVHLRSSRRARDLLPATRTIDLSHDPLGVPLTRRDGRGLSIPIVRPTMPALWCSTRSMRPSAARSFAPTPAASRPNGGDVWQLALDHQAAARYRQCPHAGERERGLARAIRGDVLQDGSAAHLRLVKGSHIVVRRLFDHDHGYIFQNSDRRVVFALPFEQDFTLIGTTDQPFAGDPRAMQAERRRNRLSLRGGEQIFPAADFTPADVIWSFAGIRSLYDDGSRKAQDTSRDYVLALDERPGLAPLLSVYGGKITTYRRLAEQALERVAPLCKAGPAWTAKSHLPGGAFAWDDLEGMIAKTHATWPFLAAVQARRLVRSYGTRVNRILDDARRASAISARVSRLHLSAAEVRYLMARNGREPPTTSCGGVASSVCG